MGILGFLNKSENETRAQTQPTSTNTVLEKLISNNLYISKNNVEQIPVVQESIKKIAGTIAGLPIELCQKQNNVNNFIEDYRLFILNTENNTYSTSYQLKYQIVEDLLLYGKSYAYIERKGTKIVGLHHIKYETVTEKNAVNENGVIIDKTYNYTLNNMVQTKNSYDILEINSGSKGILNSKKLLELIINHDDMLSNTLQNFTAPSGILKSQNRLTQVAIDRMRESWQKLYSGSNNAGKTIILEEGLSYQPLNDIDLNKLQSSDTKKSFIDDVERLFNLYGISSDSEFLKYTITPLISCIESALTSSLLLTKEKESNYKFIFNTEEIIRADEKTRVETVTMALSAGLLTINEARERLGENPFILDSEKSFLSLSMGKVLLMQDGQLTMPNLGTSMNIDETNTNLEGENNNGTDI